jgi:curli production assembly/transport component CsgG
MLFAGLILEGGIVGYDTNTTSGGAGARFLGLGVNDQYRTDQVTVSLRLIGVQTGEILLTVSATKTIASTSNGADVFKFLDLGTRALEIESGNATNEPVNYAIRTAIEYAVLQMVHEGKELGLWEWRLPIIAEKIDIVDSDIIEVNKWAEHPISKKQGE